MPHSPMPPPMILLHAFPLHSGLFGDTVIPKGWSVTTPDRRGFGGASLADADGTVPAPDLAVLADDVIARMDRDGIERAVIGGVSMGGYVTLALLAAYPDRVAGLVLADTRSTADDANGRAGRLATAERADDGDTDTGDDLVASLLAPDADPTVRTRMAEMAASAPAASIAWAQRAMAGRRDTTAALAAADVPSLIIVGEKDTVTPAADAQHMTSAARYPTLVVIPDAGHLTPAEAPEGFSRALARWAAEQWAENPSGGQRQEGQGW